MQAFFVGINSKYIHTALGIRYVTEYCRTQGCAAHMLEATVNEPILSVLTRITEKVEACVSVQSEQVLIGLEVHIWNRKFVLELAELLRKVFPNCLLLLGGPEVMFHPAETLTAAPYVDFIVCGEGEEVVADFLRKLAEYEKNYYCRKKFMEENSSVMGFTFFRDNKSEWKNLIPHGIAYRDDNGSV
ncbi:MAG: cobalamin-dependent protein, partial [Acidaminococcaceae bacterium]|nr:cobalamin-dependent protein [Acidaminococcaceae bacterium]